MTAKIIGEGLFQGVVKLDPSFRLIETRDCIDMFKIGYRLVEGAHLHARLWATNHHLEELAVEHLEALLTNRAKAIINEAIE